MNIKYSEIFTSFQGEAGFSGMPTIWVRFFGCNLECNGFGQKNPMDESTYILPYKTIDISKYKTLEELPVFEHGCDSSYSWSKQYDSLIHKAEVSDLVDRLIALGEKNFGLKSDNSKGFWKHPVTKQPVQLCFTGGEPMLWQKQMLEICMEFKNREMEPLQITIETNGTKPIKFFHGLSTTANVFYSVSPKLFSVSGEKNAVDIKLLTTYFEDSPGWLKFVVNGTKACWEELDLYMEKIIPILPSDWEVWLMPVGATKEQQEGKGVANIANEIMKRGYKVATRNHAYVYGNIIGS